MIIGKVKKGEGVQITVIDDDDDDDDDVRRTVEPHSHLDDDIDCRL